MPARLSITVDLDYGLPEPADVLLQIAAAALPDQWIETERLDVWSDLPLAAVPGEEGIGQRCWSHAVGRFTARYAATVLVDRPVHPLHLLRHTPVRHLPGPVVGYLMPSRYCPSDKLEGFVRAEFAGLTGGPLAAALAEWTARSLRYRSTGSTGTTTALDTFASREGVCRDYAHLLVTLARAAEIPARCVAAYAPDVTPPDFHAVAELWLDGGWHLVDATGMADPAETVRICVGRDATDIAFMTVFGSANLIEQRVGVERLG